MSNSFNNIKFGEKMIAADPIIISDEERRSIGAYALYIEKYFDQEDQDYNYKITRKKYTDHVKVTAETTEKSLIIKTSPLEYTAEMNRRCNIYKPTGELVLSIQLPQDPSDPGTHSCATVINNEEEILVFHGPKGSTRKSSKKSGAIEVSFKPILTQDGQGIMKRRRYYNGNQTTLFAKNSAIIAMLPDCHNENYIGNVVRKVDAVPFKINQYMLDAGEDFLNYLNRTRHLLSEEQKQITANLIVFLLAELHRAGIVHTDVKPENICIRQSGISFIDFDEAYRLGIDRPSGAGTISYYPPEFFKPDMYPFNFQYSHKPVDKEILRPLNERHFTQASDVFSLGLILKFFKIEDPAYQRFIDHMLRPEPVARIDLKKLPDDLTPYIQKRYSSHPSSSMFFDPCPWAPEKKKRQRSDDNGQENNYGNIQENLNQAFENESSSEFEVHPIQTYAL